MLMPVRSASTEAGSSAASAGRAELAASAAVRHPGGRPAFAAAPAAFRHDLLVLVIAGRADPALGTPGVDPPGPAATGACSRALAGRAGSADPAGGGLAPQVGSDLAAPGAGRGRDRLIPGIDQRVRQPDQHQRICSRGVTRAPGCSFRSASTSRSARPRSALAVARAARAAPVSSSGREAIRQDVTRASDSPSGPAAVTTGPGGGSCCAALAAAPLPRVLVVERGEPPHQFRPRPDIRRAYLGEEQTVESAPHHAFSRQARMLHLMQYRSLSAAAAGGAAAFADVAACPPGASSCRR